MATRIAMRPSRDSPDDRKKKATKLAQRNCSTLREWTGRCLDSVLGLQTTYQCGNMHQCYLEKSYADALLFSSLDAPVPPDFTEWVRMFSLPFSSTLSSRCLLSLSLLLSFPPFSPPALSLFNERGERKIEAARARDREKQRRVEKGQ
eukprot:1395332-Amorphochlora_amoeboformis.AAC.1